MRWELVLGVLGGLIGLWVALVLVLWFMRPRDVAARELVRLVPDVVRLVRGLLADASVPLAVRAALVGLLVWLVNPIDLIPEFIPVLGPLDDVIVTIVVLRFVRRRLGSDELRARWPGTSDGYDLLASVLGRGG